MLASLDDILRAALASHHAGAVPDEGDMPIMPIVAIARCADDYVLRAGVEAARQGLARPLFIGHRDKALATAKKHGLDISPYELVHEPDDVRAVRLAVRAYRKGRADLIMKGLVSTSTLLKAVLDKQRGVPPLGVLSHVTVFSPPGEERLMLLTDAGVNISPNLQRKVEIVRNAVAVARVLGMERPKVALLAATEKVNYPAMPATLDADIIAKMAGQGEFGEAEVAGPLSLDLAVSPDAARCKGMNGAVAGCADLLVAPDIESGNILYKSLSAIARVPLASVVVGSEVPVVVPSRSDSEQSKLYAMALAVLLADSAQKDKAAS